MKTIFKKIFTILGFALLQTAIFGALIFIVERLGLFTIRVHDVDGTIIYPYESALFFFILIMIADVGVELIRNPIKTKPTEVDITCEWNEDTNSYVCPEDFSPNS